MILLPDRNKYRNILIIITQRTLSHVEQTEIRDLCAIRNY